MHTKEEILQMFDLFRGNSVGIETWITPKTDEDIFNTLGNIDTTLLGKSQLNQLLILSHEADISDDFFKYYWMSAPKHTYNVKLIYKFEEEWLKGDCIKSLEHLKWGLYRLYPPTCPRIEANSHAFSPSKPSAASPASCNTPSVPTLPPCQTMQPPVVALVAEARRYQSTSPKATRSRQQRNPTTRQ